MRGIGGLTSVIWTYFYRKRTVLEQGFYHQMPNFSSGYSWFLQVIVDIGPIYEMTSHLFEPILAQVKQSHLHDHDHEGLGCQLLHEEPHIYKPFSQIYDLSKFMGKLDLGRHSYCFGPEADF